MKGKIEVTVYIAKALESIRTDRKRGMVSLQVKYLFQTLNTYQNLDVAANGLWLVLDTTIRRVNIPPETTGYVL